MRVVEDRVKAIVGVGMMVGRVKVMVRVGRKDGEYDGSGVAGKYGR